MRRVLLLGTINRRGAEDRKLPDIEANRLASRYGFSSVATGLVVRSLWDVKRPGINHG